MPHSSLRKKMGQLLSLADIKIDGDRPWDIQVHNDDLYARILTEGSLGLGESYMDGWWDCSRLDEFFYRILHAQLDKKVKSRTWYLEALKAKLFNPQKPSRSMQIGQHHYDIDNNLYKCMLDENMIYSCAYWKNASTLEEAQVAKMNLVCRKLDLLPGMRLLDIGCGWGGFAKFAAERYQAEVVGITVSVQQAKFGKEL